MIFKDLKDLFNWANHIKLTFYVEVSHTIYSIL